MHIETTIGSAADRVMAALVSGLELEFGRGAGAGLAQRFLEAEAVDFLWDARVQERWLGGYGIDEEDGIELDRVAVFGRLDGRWFAAVLIVDGDGNPHGLMGRREFRRRAAAETAYLDAR